MPEKSALIQTRVTPDIRARLEAVAEGAGLTVSGLLRMLAENVVEGYAPPTAERLPSRSRREGKVTVRLDKDVRDALDEEARERRISVATWAASMIRRAIGAARSRCQMTVRRFSVPFVSSAGWR